MEQRINNIKKLEVILDKATALFNDLEQMIEELEKFHPEFQKLMNYYGSEEWMQDVEDSNKGIFDDIKCGVLSEDAIYNLYTQQRFLHFKMMRIALDYLEK